MTATVHAAPRGRWIPWAFVGGMALVLAVNLVLVWAALGTYAGTTTGGAYDRGRHYGQVLEEAARQQALGWQARLAVEGGSLLLRARDRAGVPLPASVTVAARLQRPLAREGVALEFAPVGPGLWRAPLAAEPGQWEAILTLAAGADRVEHRQRLVLP
ncbi:FixH family protein [Siccirubricoccus sp. KC 17139]|uniref:FixH family protein n=1 Tax=Siccirubricoccus soli TaxID=2899147 RepID=A0ABT1D7H5_9PROT|nr:FixH family protein [Siccirubricoccus soli]MCO6417898.1 FixH family protein [Siccirubricoccus soli]MCP2684033.1 FixH family protein [Siccirubricoccus soli]